jgi:Cytochrome oxidase complex assembly protein 1
MRRVWLLSLGAPRAPPVGNRHYQEIRLFNSSALRNDIRFPHGVPAFPISPSKSTPRPRPLPAYKDVRPNTARNVMVFLAICGGWTIAALAAINYERFASPVTASTLHEVRKSPQARALLGTDIQHRSMHPEYKGWYRYDGWFRQPWISGTIQLTKGTIDIAYDVKGSGATRVYKQLTHRCGRSYAFC